MNLPNILTLMRVVLTFATTVLLFIDIQYFATSALIVYFVAGITDWFDGYIARKCNIVTNFGKFMDALSDKIMVVTMFMTLFALNLYQNWTAIALICAIISMAREFYISGVRMLASKKGVVIAA
ncbi:MAG: CDP-alcohol phosphatidyltransferase family protein, partial [Opitutales bacterium]|nr:CDP-alcohol phosphatidyltransferase family protein [Opitutales bacterium]